MLEGKIKISKQMVNSTKSGKITSSNGRTAVFQESTTKAKDSDEGPLQPTFIVELALD